MNASVARITAGSMTITLSRKSFLFHFGFWRYCFPFTISSPRNNPLTILIILDRPIAVKEEALPDKPDKQANHNQGWENHSSLENGTSSDTFAIYYHHSRVFVGLVEYFQYIWARFFYQEKGDVSGFVKCSYTIVIHLLKSPDEPFHNFVASKSVARRSWTT